MMQTLVLEPHLSRALTYPVTSVFPPVEQDSCVPSVASPTELTEGFEGKLSPLWQSLSGGQIGGGCGIISEGKALYFSSPGRREARTVPLDTSNTRLADTARSHHLEMSCRQCVFLPRTQSFDICWQVGPVLHSHRQQESGSNLHQASITQ